VIVTVTTPNLRHGDVLHHLSVRILATLRTSDERYRAAVCDDHDPDLRWTMVFSPDALHEVTRPDPLLFHLTRGARMYVDVHSYGPSLVRYSYRPTRCRYVDPSKVHVKTRPTFDRYFTEGTAP